MSLSASIRTMLVLILLSKAAVSTCCAQDLPEVDLGAAQESIINACKSNPALHGAWIKLEPLPEPKSKTTKIQAKLIVDSSRASTQTEELRALLKSLPIDGPVVEVEVIEIPFSKLIADLQRQARARFNDPGTIVGGGYLSVVEDSGLELHIYGRVESRAMAGAIVADGSELMKKDPMWGKAGIRLVDRELQPRNADLEQKRSDKTAAEARVKAALEALAKAREALTRDVAAKEATAKEAAAKEASNSGAASEPAADPASDPANVPQNDPSMPPAEDLDQVVIDAEKKLKAAQSELADADDSLKKEVKKFEESMSKLLRDREIVARALQNISSVRGMYIGLEENLDHNNEFVDYDVYVRVDRSQKAKQSEEVDAILKRYIVDRRFKTVEMLALPVTELINDINLNMEADSKYGGVMLTDAYFVPEDDSHRQLKLMFIGRYQNQEQASGLIDQICPSLMDTSLDWRGIANKHRPTAEALTRVESDIDRGAQFFFTGLKHFREHRYDEAVEAFRYAVVDAPFTLHYRYWRALALMRAGRKQEAYIHILATEKRGVTSLERVQVLRSFERIQCVCRQEIIRLEDQARREFYLFDRVARRYPSNDRYNAARSL